MPEMYTIELNLTGRRVVLIGGGAVAARKVNSLLEAGARVHVVSPEFSVELRSLHGCTLEAREYAADVLDGATLAFACTDDRELNACIAADARARGVWCNVADSAAESDFLVPAVLRRGRFAVAVSTDGTAPALAARVRELLESQFGPEYGILAEQLGRVRQLVQQEVGDAALRGRVFAALASARSLEVLSSQGEAAWRDWVQRVLQDARGESSGGTSAPGPEQSPKPAP